MNNVINKYLVIGFLKAILNVLLVFVCLGIILTFFEEIEFFKDLDIGLGLPFILTLVFIPNELVNLLPFIIFFAAMWYFVLIKSNADLLSLKVFGFSNFKIILVLAFTAFFFGCAVIIAVNPITSSMIKYYEGTKAQYSKFIDHLVSINKNGVWIKETIEGNLRIINAKRIDGNNLYDLSVYQMDATSKIVERIDAKKADISNNEWKLTSTTFFRFDNQETTSKLLDNYTLYSIYNIEKLNSLYKNLDTISFYELINKYDLLITKGYSKEKLNEKLNIFFSMPIFLFLMVILASIFTVGSVGRSQNFYYIFISMIACVVIYYFKDLSIALGQTNRISLTLSVWIPIIAISLFCSIGVLQINEK
jgi:lipopolysaccharide export system permease protein